MTRTIESVLTTTDIIEILRKQDGATISEIAAELDLTPGTIHTHLSTLKERDYVIQTGGEYRLGYHLLALGESVRNHHELYRAAKDEIESLAEETGESAHLIIEHDGRIFALYERFGKEAVGVEFHKRKREQPLTHLHCTAAGKAILSQLSEERASEVLDRRGLPRLTENTITDREELIDDLETSRERGYAFSDEEQMTGIRAVGAPIGGQNDDPVGAIAISGPTARLQSETFQERLPQMVVQATNICEVNLQTERTDPLKL